MTRTLLAITCFAVAGCGADPLLNQSPPIADAPAPVRAAVGDTIRLTPGGVAEVPAAGLLIAFEGISGDSRCPSGVECAWSGDAAARIRVSTGAGGDAPLELHTHLEPRDVLHGPYRIALLAVEPYPVYGEQLEGSEYAVLLRVTRR